MDPYRVFPSSSPSFLDLSLMCFRACQWGFDFPSSTLRSWFLIVSKSLRLFFIDFETNPLIEKWVFISGGEGGGYEIVYVYWKGRHGTELLRLFCLFLF